MRNLCMLAVLLVGSSAGATLPRPTGGSQKVRIQYSGDARKQLAAGSLKSGASIPLLLGFNLPPDTSCQVRITFRPASGVAEIPNAQPLSGQENFKEAPILVGDSALGENGRVYQMSCGQFQAGGRSQLPFTFRPLAKPGRASAIDTVVHVFGGKNLVQSVGYATLVLATNANGVLSPASSEQVNAQQLSAILKDKQVQLQELVATEVDTLPLNEKQIPSTHSDDMSDYPKDTSKQ